MAIANSPLAFTPTPELSVGVSLLLVLVLPLLVPVELADFVALGVPVASVVFEELVEFEAAAKVPPKTSESGEIFMLLSLAAAEYVSITVWFGWLTKPYIPSLQ